MLLLQKDREERQKRHTESCLGVLGVIYDFNTKTLVSFQDNFNSKDDLPFVLILKLQLQQITSLIQNKKNVFCILCFDCCFSSSAKFR